MGWQISGKLGKPEYDDPYGVFGIYRTTNTGNGRVVQKMPFYTPTNPNTPAQQAQRLKFKNAMIAWQSLTTEQKNEYTRRAKIRGWYGRNLFIREYYQNNP